MAALQTLVDDLAQAVAQHKAGRPEAAARLYRQVLAREPGHPHANHNLALILIQAGDIPAAVEHLRAALRSDPDNAMIHYRLGSLLAANDAVDEGFAHLRRRAELARGMDDKALGADAALHKRKHDAEQRAYLIAHDLIPAEAPPNAFRLAAGERLAGPAVDAARATPELFAAWAASRPQLVVVDDFLTEPALQALRDYCAASTIWRKVYDAGYIGAAPHDGLACPLTAQLAEEIRVAYAPILAPHPFQHLGAFKYDSELSTGTNTHADYSAVNVNLYIAPDEANLDPETGGMVVWDVAAADEAEMRRFNSDETALQAHLSASGKPPVRVAHRANRAVIFRSSLYHRTDDCRFSEGYLNKRINVSLLYGRWADREL